ncbi:N-acetylmuramoyl-L-alanine amidase [Paenibacillus zanthoxyli]|uniref:N-acetylmuramoyl-L-alanine amidase n=1 Tax=Paenibacillus zanthoxyli TaxID=369399 RepID=UPI00046FAC0A|nr:N-acetylmuramoyl-L-alanine amidase [Paenibacillus zanthoxyli]
MKKVWIDAGHGGKDPGGIGNGLKEKDIVLTVSLGIRERLERDYDGVQVLLSRSADGFLELKERTDLANKAGADILVSIHCNAGGGKGGFETFRYVQASAASATLQNVLHKAIKARLDSSAPGVVDRGQKADNLHMVRESKMPAVLTENLFVDVAADAGRLKNTAVLNAIIDGHVYGIAQYLGLNRKELESAGNEDRATVVVNGKRLDATAPLIEGTVHVPLRAVAEALGVKVSWDNQTKTASITK